MSESERESEYMEILGLESEEKEEKQLQVQRPPSLTFGRF